MKDKVLTIDARMLFAGGIGTYLQNLLKRIRFETLGLRVEIYVRTDAQAAWMRQYQPDATIKRCPHWIYGIEEQLFWLKNLKGGLFWAPHFNIPWRGYERLVVTVHDCFPLTPIAHPLMRLYGGVMFGRIKRAANAIITVSDFSKNEMAVRAKISPNRVNVIYSGVAPVWFTRAEGSPPYDFPYLVYIGNLKVHKNLRRLLQAFEKLQTNHKLVVVGPKKELKMRDDAALNLMGHLRERVVPVERATDEELLRLVKHARGLVLPSLYEGFGLPPLEAMAAGVPTLVGNAASMPEICGPAALYCDPTSVEDIQEGIEKLIHLQGEERERRIEKGYEHAAQFNWDKTVTQTLEVFRRTLS